MIFREIFIKCRHSTKCLWCFNSTRVLNEYTLSEITLHKKRTPQLLFNYLNFIMSVQSVSLTHIPQFMF